MHSMLGDIVFEALTGPTEENVRQSYDYAEHALIEGKPDLQYIGEGLIERDLSMHFHASFCRPAEQLQKLRAAASPPQALDLIMGHSGAYAHQGTYVIAEIAQTTDWTVPDGELLAVTVQVKLREYVLTRYLSTAAPGVRQ